MSGSNQTASSDDHFTISRVFDAPRELVWQAWTAPERIVAWFGPKGLPPARVIRHELREGGVFLSATKMPDGSEMCGNSYIAKSPRSRASFGFIHSPM
jgi:uncharacterized protein YndB with AHSA1/START domain